jgi:hypothetical protein
VGRTPCPTAVSALIAALSCLILGEEAEFDAEETAQMRSVRRECETRVNRYEDRIAEIQSDMQKEIDKQAHLLRKITKDRQTSPSVEEDHEGAECQELVQ